MNNLSVLCPDRTWKEILSISIVIKIIFKSKYNGSTSKWKKIHYFINLIVLFQNMTAISPTRKYLSANFTAISSLSAQSHALALKQILAFLLGPVNWDQNLHKGYINCPSYIVIPDYLTEMTLLELAMFHFICTLVKILVPANLQYFGSIMWVFWSKA